MYDRDVLIVSGKVRDAYVSGNSEAGMVIFAFCVSQMLFISPRCMQLIMSGCTDRDALIVSAMWRRRCLIPLLARRMY